MLTGKTKNLGIIGYPIEHSLSPVMQNAAINHAKIDYTYVAMPVRPKELKTAFQGLKSLGFQGFNVTIPHKVNIMPLLDQIDEDAKRIGAVNTVVLKDGISIGYNTDCVGFIKSLKNNDVEIKGKNAVLLGAGGAARAVIWGLIKEGVASISIGVRNPDKVEGLIADFSDVFQINLFKWSELQFERSLEICDILINCTPLGMYPNINDMPPVQWCLFKNNIVVCDLIYTPQLTQFLAKAKSFGHKFINGEGMLVEQGAAAFQLWINIYPSSNIMQKALEKALVGKDQDE